MLSANVVFNVFPVVFNVTNCYYNLFSIMFAKTSLLFRFVASVFDYSLRIYLCVVPFGVIQTSILLFVFRIMLIIKHN